MKAIQHIISFYRHSKSRHASSCWLKQLVLSVCLLLSFVSSSAQVDSAKASQNLIEAQKRLDSLDYQEAIAISTAVIATYDPPNVDTHLIKAFSIYGDALREQGEYDAALKQYQQAEETAILLNSAIHPATAQANNDMGLCYWKKGLLPEALQYFEKALQIRLKVFGERHPKVADSYNNLGNCAFDKRDLNAARDYYEKSLNIRVAALPVDDPDIASSYNNLGSCYKFARQYETAIEYYSKAITIREAKLGRNHPKVAQSCNNLGQCYEQMGSLQEAIQYYERSMAIRQSNGQGNHPDIATDYLGLGGCYSQFGNHALALNYFEDALAIQKANFSEDSPNLISVYNNLANSYKTLGDYNQAMLFYENNIHLLNSTFGQQHPFSAATHNNIGLIQVELLQFDKALTSYGKALNIYEQQEDYPRIARIWNNIGTCFRQQKNFSEAIEAYQRSFSISKQLYGENHPDNIAAYYNIGNCLGEQNQLENALAYYEKALELTNANGDANKTKLAIYKTSIGTTRHKQGNYQGALEMFDNALQDLRIDLRQEAEYIASPIDVISLLNAKVKTMLALSKGATSSNTLKEILPIVDFAIQLISNLRRQYQEEYSKRKLNETANETFQLGIAAAHAIYQQSKEQSYLEAAFRYAELSRGNLILEQQMNQQAAAYANIPDSLWSKESQLKTSIAYHEKQKYAAGIDSASTEELDNILFEEKQRYQQLIQQFETDYPTYYQLKYDDTTVPITDLQKELDSDEAILEYFVSDTTVYIFFIDKNRTHLEEVLVDSLAEEVRLLRVGIHRYYMDTDAQTEEGYRILLIQYLRTANFLYRKLMEPVAEYLPEKLTIINSGVLTYLPFDALVKNLPEGALHRLRGIEYVIKHHEINYAYSATLLHLLSNRQRTSEPAKKAVAFAPVFTFPNPLGLAPLAHNITEAKLINMLLPGSDIYLDTLATKEQFLAIASDYQILHLATHGKSNADLGDYSFLAFAASENSTKQDALLYAKDIYNLNLQADLVVLSACETGTGELLQGEGVVSLARAFFYAGAQSVVTTLWSINDATTKNIIASFYNNRKQGLSDGAALRTAKLEYIEKSDDPHPFFWAAFVLTGETESVANTGTSLGTAILLFIGVVFLLLFLVYLLEKKGRF